MIEEIVIRNENDAWDILQKALADEITETALITFEGWPVFKLTIKGKDFMGSIPTRIMPPILDLQKEIHRIYCKVKYNSEDTRKLKQHERELLELVVSIKPGSTKFLTELFKALNEIIKSSNMTGKEAIVLLVGVSTIIATTIGWKDWVSSRERTHGMDVSVRLSEQETERVEIITEALTTSSELRQNKQFISEFKSDLSKSLKPEDQIKVDQEPIITGTRAAEITPTPRKVAEEVRLDGEFLVTGVKFPKKPGGEYRFAVTRMIDDKKFSVNVSPSKLTTEQITIIKDGSFGVRKMVMEINAKELRGRISAANLVSIKWPEQS